MQERSINQLLPTYAWTGDRTYKLSMCPDWELNVQPFQLLDNAPPNRATLAQAHHNTFDAGLYLLV